MQQTIMRTSFKVKRSKVKVTRSITAETETEREGLRTSKFLCRWSMLKLPRLAIKAYKVGILHSGEGIPCRPNPAATQLVKRYLIWLGLSAPLIRSFSTMALYKSIYLLTYLTWNYKYLDRYLFNKYLNGGICNFKFVSRLTGFGNGR